MSKCNSHLNRSEWIDQPHPSRIGWIRTCCKRCGAFIGNRPKEIDRKGKPKDDPGRDE